MGWTIRKPWTTSSLTWAPITENVVCKPSKGVGGGCGLVRRHRHARARSCPVQFQRRGGRGLAVGGPGPRDHIRPARGARRGELGHARWLVGGCFGRSSHALPGEYRRIDPARFARLGGVHRLAGPGQPVVLPLYPERPFPWVYPRRGRARL